MQKTDIINSNRIAKDVSSLVDHIISLSTKDKEWFSKIYCREVIKSQHYAVQSQDESTIYVNYVVSQELLDNARYIVDWLAGLQERDPNQHGKLSRITFQQALEHSKKWHTALAKKAEQSDRHIEPDAINAPKVLDLGDGWEVFWLKTDAARDVEGEVMGHCVGSGAYDDFEDDEAVFSIRRNNMVHITLHMEELKIKQAVTKGNGDVPERYQHLVDEATDILGAKLFIGHPLEDLSPIPDGWHENKKGDKFHIRDGDLHYNNNNPSIIYANGKQEWCKNRQLHRNNGPAVIYQDGSQEWWEDGKRHRDNGPAVIRADGCQYWYKNGLRHRDDGPAFIHPHGTVWYKNDKRHREDGPAAIGRNGSKGWWLEGNLYTEKEFNYIIKQNKNMRGKHSSTSCGQING